MNIDTASLGDAVVKLGEGSSDAAPSLGTGSDAIDYAPFFPGHLIGVIGEFLKNFGL